MVTTTPQQVPSTRGDEGPSVRAQRKTLVFRDLRSDNSRFVVQAAKSHKSGADVLEQF